MKRRTPSQRQADGGFYQPFRELKGVVKEKPRPAAVSRPPSPPPPANTEEQVFLEAMGGVVPLEERPAVSPPAVPVPKVVSDEAETLAALSDLVSGTGPFDIADSDEFIEAKAQDLDSRVLRALCRGEYAIQGHLDLHGMTRAEAHQEVEKFVQESRAQKKRCILLIHGRGLRSKDQIPVLKEQLKMWLRKGRLGKSVLAFATARPHDGGAGALYVLLRRLNAKSGRGLPSGHGPK